MPSLGLLAISSFLMALLLTPLNRNLFRRWGVVDRPDGGRHLHGQPVPRIGGIPIVTAYVGTFATLAGSPLTLGTVVIERLPLAWKIFPAAALVFSVGLIDDVRGLRPGASWLRRLSLPVSHIGPVWK